MVRLAPSRFKPPSVRWRIPWRRRPSTEEEEAPEPSFIPYGDGGDLAVSENSDPPREKQGGATELVYIFEMDAKWSARVPVVELIANLPLACRWIPKGGDGVYRLAGILIITTLMIGLFTGLVFIVVPNIGIALLGGIVTGLFPGLGFGWILGPPIGRLVLRGTAPEPYWIVRRFPWDVMNQDYTDTLPVSSPYVILPQIHSRELGRDPQSEAPGVFTGTAFHELMEARAVRRWFTGKMSWGRKIQLASMGIVAGCMVGVVAFLVLATME